MLSLFKWFLKTAIFTFVVLIAAQLIRWNGKTLSQHVQKGMQKTPAVTEWSSKVLKDASQGLKAQALPATVASNSQDHIKSSAAQSRTSRAPQHQIAETERDKLRDLIKELNTPSAD